MGQTELFHEHKSISPKWAQSFHDKMNSVTGKQTMRNPKYDKQDERQHLKKYFMPKWTVS